MSVPQAIQEHLDKKEFDAVEDAWLAQIEEDVSDHAFFADVGHALARAGEEERARFLAEMVDEHLREGDLWQERLGLLERAGTLLFGEPGELHPQILETLRQLHGERPSYGQMVEKVGLHRAVDDIPKTFKKAERLAGLLAFDVGSIVHLEGKGAGRVVEVNMQLESFKVELDGQPDLRVGFGGAAKLLQPIGPDHVLYRKLTDKDALAALGEREPGELLRVVLQSYDSPRTGGEIRRDLQGVVPDNKWTGWWAAARKHPQVLHQGSGARQSYTWAASSGHAQDAVWEAFETAEPRARIELLRKNGERDPELRERMSEALAEIAVAVVDSDPGLACEIWYGLEKYGTDPGAVAWSPGALTTRLEARQVPALAAGIQDRSLRERTYRIASQSRDDWPEVGLALMWQETEPKALDTLHQSLPQDLFDGFFDQILSQPKKNPGAFTWMVERAKDEPAWLRRNPLRLMRQFLWSLTSADFASYKTRLDPLCDSGGTLPRLLDHLNEDQAVQVDETLQKTAAILDYQRQPLLNALHLRFPSLRVVEAPLYALAPSITQKREELRVLLEEEIPANRRAIEAARELGDLRENFEYKSARQRHEYLTARATALDRDLGRARPIDISTVTGNEVVIGSRVRFEGNSGERVLTILGPWESKPEENVLSNESELAQRLLGAKVGVEVELDDGTWRIASVEPFAQPG